MFQALSGDGELKAICPGKKGCRFLTSLNFGASQMSLLSPPQVTLIRLMSAEQLKIRKPRGAALHLEPEILNFKKQFKGGLNYES